MIISRSPLRITLGGGGTDLPSYYLQNEGFLIAAAIDKYVYVSASKPFLDGFFIKYAQTEEVLSIDQIKHPIVREFLKYNEFSGSALELSSFADIPSGTGLGSSGSFATALIRAIYAFKKQQITQEKLAEMAAHLEIDILNEPIGKQDQYIAAYGGLTCFKFHSDGSVEAEPLKVSNETITKLESNLLLFFTGQTRSASNVLQDQKLKSENGDKEMLKNLDYIKDQAYRSKAALEGGDLREFASVMHDHWMKKRIRSKDISSSRIDALYELGLKNGALGGKVVGAGGGGFLMFYAEDKKDLRLQMQNSGLHEVRFGFDFQGTKLIYG